MIVACLKWIDRRPEAAALLADEMPDGRFAGVSAADCAALEWALRTRRDGEDVVAVTVGPAGAESVLRDALAVGATRAVRVDLPFEAPSRTVATAIAGVAADARLVWCGDASADRGTGSVPAFIAHSLGIGQALGLIGVEHDGDALRGLRRLDGGRRERLAIDGRAVVSVEGPTAALRRAGLRSLLGTKPVEVLSAPRGGAHDAPVIADVRPFRPRPRVNPAPAGASALDRIRALTSAGAAAPARGETVELPPAEAAERILAALREWDYLPDDA